MSKLQNELLYNAGCVGVPAAEVSGVSVVARNKPTIVPWDIDCADLHLILSNTARNSFDQLFSSTQVVHRQQLVMFYIIGLGLCDEKDITVRGLEVRIIIFALAVYPD